MADSSALTPASYDQYVAGVLQDTGTLLAPAKAKPAAQAAPGASLKASPGPYDTYIGDTLKDVDALLAPSKEATPATPPEGPMETILKRAEGGLEGAANLVTGGIKFLTGATGAAKVADTAFDSDASSEATADFMRFDPTDPAVKEGEAAASGAFDTAMQAPGTSGEEFLVGATQGAKTNPSTVIRGRFGINMPGADNMGPGEPPLDPRARAASAIMGYDPSKPQPKVIPQAQDALTEARARLGGNLLGNFAAMGMGAKEAPKTRGVPLEEPTEPPPPPGSTPGGPEYTAPDVHKSGTQVPPPDLKGKRAADQQAASEKVVSDIASTNRRQSGVAAEVRKVYDSLTPKEKETTALQDSQTGLYSRGMYDRMAAGDKPQVFFDLRDLKQANDVHGHGYGDAVIKAFGDAAKAAGVSGQMFRYGGDEFSMLVDGPEGLAQARKLQKQLQGATVEAILPDGTKITTKGIDADYGYGKNKDAADQAAYTAKRANKAAPADAQAGGKRTRLGGAPAEGDQVQGQPGHSPDLTRRFAGTQSSTHTPYPEGSPPGDYVLGKIRLKQGDRDVVVPVRTEFETPADEELYKVGEQVLKTWGEDKEPRPNTASPGERELLMRMRQYLAKADPAWRQNDDRANLAYARQFAREVRDHHQRGYNVLRDHLEENFPDNPKGELRANPHKYAFSTKVPKWQPRDLVTKCF